MTLQLGAVVPVSLLAEIDCKLDDGNPLLGAFQVVDGEKVLCTTEDGQWNEANGEPCVAVYVIR